MAVTKRKKMWKHFFCSHMKTFKVKWHSTDMGHNFGKKHIPCGLFDFFKLVLCNKSSHRKSWEQYRYPPSSGCENVHYFLVLCYSPSRGSEYCNLFLVICYHKKCSVYNYRYPSTRSSCYCTFFTCNMLSQRKFCLEYSLYPPTRDLEYCNLFLVICYHKDNSGNSIGTLPPGAQTTLIYLLVICYHKGSSGYRHYRYPSTRGSEYCNLFLMICYHKGNSGNSIGTLPPGALTTVIYLLVICYHKECYVYSIGTLQPGAQNTVIYFL